MMAVKVLNKLCRLYSLPGLLSHSHGGRRLPHFGSMHHLSGFTFLLFTSCLCLFLYLSVTLTY